MTVKVLRTTGGVAAGVVRAIDAKGSPIGEARYAFGMQDRETEAAFDLPVELRNDISRLEISGERSAGAVQLLDKRWRRRAVGVVTGATSDTAQPLLASTFYLTRALVAVRRRAARRPRRAAAGDRAIPRSAAADDRAGRCRHAVAGNPRAAQRLDRPGRRAGALRRPPSGAGRRRSGAGEAAPRRPHPRRQPDLGKAAASGLLRRRRPVRRPRRAEGHHREPAGAGRAGRGARDQELGVAGRRHAAGHRRASRQGHGQPVPCRRRHRAGRTCRCPAASSRCCGGWSTCPATPRSPARALPARRPMSRRWRRCARSTASARSDRRPRPPSRCRPITATAPRRIIRRASTARPTARSRSTRWPPPIASRRSTPPRCARSAPATPTPNRAICAACCCRRRWRCS